LNCDNKVTLVVHVYRTIVAVTEYSWEYKLEMHNTVHKNERTN
jgi:hypothetical protein